MVPERPARKRSALSLRSSSCSAGIHGAPSASSIMHSAVKHHSALWAGSLCALQTQ